MAQIVLEDIRKHFKVYERPEGKWAVLRGAFTRTVRTVKALDGIGFQIEKGELVGYIGPNGAGKSTSVKVMSGILTPDSGRCEIMGRVPWKERVKHVSHIGVVFGQRSQLWWDVPVMDSFELLRDIYCVEEKAFRARVERLVEMLDIGTLLKTPVRQLSLGQRMRCELAAAPLHSPEILFLDEPTIGLDAVSKLKLRAFLKQENAQGGVTMLLTTHDMDDIQALCSRVMVIGHGRLLYDGGLTSLREKYAPLTSLKITFSDAPPECGALMGIAGVEAALPDGEGVRITFDSKHMAAHAMISQIAGKFPVQDIAIDEPDIDEVIASMYGDMDL